MLKSEWWKVQGQVIGEEAETKRGVKIEDES